MHILFIYASYKWFHYYNSELIEQQTRYTYLKICFIKVLFLPTSLAELAVAGYPIGSISCNWDWDFGFGVGIVYFLNWVSPVLVAGLGRSYS